MGLKTRDNASALTKCQDFTSRVLARGAEQSFLTKGIGLTKTDPAFFDFFKIASSANVRNRNQLPKVAAKSSAPIARYFAIIQPLPHSVRRVS